MPGNRTAKAKEKVSGPKHQLSNYVLIRAERCKIGTAEDLLVTGTETEWGATASVSFRSCLSTGADDQDGFRGPRPGTAEDQRQAQKVKRANRGELFAVHRGFTSNSWNTAAIGAQHYHWIRDSRQGFSNRSRRRISKALPITCGINCARSDPRVREKQRRYLTRSDIPEPIDLCVLDVSFISLTLILPRAFELLRPDGVIIPLIKPQFELHKEQVGKGGVVRDPALHAAAVEKIRAFVSGPLGRTWGGWIESPIPGGAGNKEFLACLRGNSA